MRALGVPVSGWSEARPHGHAKVWPALTWKFLANEAHYLRSRPGPRSGFRGPRAHLPLAGLPIEAGGVGWRRLLPGGPSGSAPVATQRCT